MISNYTIVMIKPNDNESWANLLNTFIYGSCRLPLNTKPTRKTHSTATPTDDIYLNLRPVIGLTSGILETGMSDHVFVFLSTYIHVYCEKLDHIKKIIMTHRKLNSRSTCRNPHKLNSIEQTNLHDIYGYIRTVFDIHQHFKRYNKQGTSIKQLTVFCNR